MLNIKELVPIGQVAVFYLPLIKLDFVHLGRTVRDYIHDFLIEHYDAYTLATAENHGFWRKDKTSQIIHDANARYEVSFGGKEKIPAFVGFLARTCSILGEEAIYLTMGQQSYLVLPQETDEI
jgi:hypothetical protein